MKSLEKVIESLKSKTNSTDVVALKSATDDPTRVSRDESSIDNDRYSHTYL